MKNNKNIYIIATTVLIVVIGLMVINNKKRYSIERPINAYNIKDDIVKKEYLDNIKMYIKSEKLKKFIDYDYINLNGYKDSVTGNAALREMEVEGYLSLFNSMFDKERINFNDCPVTDSFKEKFKENLLKHFDLIESDDSISICMVDYDEKKIEVNVYSNFENTEPTSVNNYHFHYTLDSEGNVDDVIFDKKSD